MSAGSLPKCCGFITLQVAVSHFTKCRKNRPVIRDCRLWFGIPDIKVLVVKCKKKFLMKYANSANGLCQLFGIGALWEYYSCVFFVLFIACFSTTIPYLWWNKVVYCMRKANKYHKISGESNTKVIRNPYPGQDHHQNLTPFRGSPLAHAMHHMFGRRPLPQPWVILLTERQTERPITLLRQPWRRKNIYQH